MIPWNNFNASFFVLVCLLSACTKKEYSLTTPYNSSNRKNAITVSVTESSNIAVVTNENQYITEVNNDFTTLTNKVANVNPVYKTEANAVHKSDKLYKKEARKRIKHALKSQEDGETNKLLLILIAIFIPPLAVALVDGISGPFWLDLILTLLFYVPGLVYAIFRIMKKYS